MMKIGVDVLKYVKLHVSFGIILGLSLIYIATFSTAVNAATEYTYGDFSYVIETGTITITKYNGSSANVTIPNTITKDGTTYKVRSIGNRAFEDKMQIKAVTIPSNIASIGNYAFQNCVNISSISINGNIDKVYAGRYGNPFINVGSNANSLTVTFGNEVKKIAANLFKTGMGYDSRNGRYAYVTKVVMSDSITEVGASAFEDCYSLREIIWGVGIVSIGHSAFADTDIRDIVLPASCTTVDPYAFYNCVNVSSITINGNIDKVYAGRYGNPFINVGSNASSLTVAFGNGVKKISTNLFDTGIGYESGNGKYAHVTKVVMSDSIAEIGASAFDGCYSLREIIWGAGIVYIGRSAFEDTDIRSILLPASCTTVDPYAFYNCVNVISITINGNIDKVYAGRYGNPFINVGLKVNSLVVYFGNTAKKVPENLFNTGAAYKSGNGEYTHVTKVVISDGVKHIGGAAFKGCYDLNSVTIGKNVKTIGRKAFYECKKLKSLEIKTKRLTKKRVNGSLEGSKIKRIKVKVGSPKTNRKYIKKYKKIFTKANAGRKVKIK